MPSWSLWGSPWCSILLSASHRRALTSGEMLSGPLHNPHVSASVQGNMNVIVEHLRTNSARPLHMRVGPLAVVGIIVLWVCRGHLGGLIGGAMTAYLLGPNIQIMEGKGGKKQVQDNPPIPIFASKL